MNSKLESGHVMAPEAANPKSISDLAVNPTPNKKAAGSFSSANTKPASAQSIAE